MQAVDVGVDEAKMDDGRKPPQQGHQVTPQVLELDAGEAEDVDDGESSDPPVPAEALFGRLVSGQIENVVLDVD